MIIYNTYNNSKNTHNTLIEKVQPTWQNRIIINEKPNQPVHYVCLLWTGLPTQTE